MKRCLILIGNEGSPTEGNFLPGVKKDIDRYSAFFRSDFGGAWEGAEIESRNFGWTRISLQSAIFSRRLSKLDYALIVFAGHGYAERNGDVYFELSPNEEISFSEIKSFLPYQKMLMIADSCQGYLDEPLSKSLTESIKIFSAGGRIMDSRDAMRNRYNHLIDRVAKNTKVFVSAVSSGECAADTSIGGLYSRILMDSSEKIIENTSNRAYCTIDKLHSLAAEEVVRISGGRQHPSLWLDKDSDCPPFLIL